MEEIHQENIERHKGSQNAAGHQQEQNEEFLFTRTNFLRATRRSKGNQCGHQHHYDADAIHTYVIMDVQRRNPFHALGKFIAVLVFQSRFLSALSR